MKKTTGTKFSYSFALAAGLILVLLAAAFTAAPLAQAKQTSAVDGPSYCSTLPELYVVNKYGYKTLIPDGTTINRVAGDRVNLFVNVVPGETEVMPTVRTLLGNKEEIVYDRFGNFGAEGYYSFYAAPGTFAIGYNLTQEQYNACGGAGAFENVIEHNGSYFVISHYLIINVTAPTPQPRENAAPAVLPIT